MTENNDFDEINQESSDASQPCCPSTPAGGKTWKTVVFLVVILLAGAVAAHSLLTKGSACPVGSSCAVGSSCGAASSANATPSCGACGTGSDACCAAGSGNASATAADSVAVPSEGNK